MNPLPHGFRHTLVLICALGITSTRAAETRSLGQQLGTIRFEVTGTDAARAHVVRGVKLMHHMMYVEADREFAAAMAADHRCALAHWGRAMAIVHPLWPDVLNESHFKQGRGFVEAGLALATATARERAYLEAIGAYFRDAEAKPELARLQALDEAWDDVARKFPDDLDALAFSALFHLAPARFLPKDKSYRIQLEASARVKKVLARIPDHPGAQHYKIHAHDFPLLAGRALEICDTYGTIAPDVPHALHMPTHIFTRNGLWEKSIELNTRSAKAAMEMAKSAGSMNGHYTHALDYLVYAYLQRGQYRDADAIRREVETMSGPYHPSSLGTTAFAFAAIPARYALERHDWAAAARLELRRPASFPWNDQHGHCDSITYFARSIGAVRSGAIADARRNIEEHARLQQRLGPPKPGAYWASQAETQIMTARAWLALKEGKTSEALASMRNAASLEAMSDKEAVTPGEVLPAGELLGDMLLELKMPKDAVAAFEAVLEVAPNRLNSLFGAARAAELAGDRAKATSHYRQLMTVAASADPGLEPLQRAKAFLAQQPKGRAE